MRDIEVLRKGNRLSIGDLKQRQSLPLEQKILKSIRTIEDFYNLTGGECYISTSGADSCVLDWLVKQTFCDKYIKRVSVAGAEPVENIKLLHNRGDMLLPCTTNKKQVIRDWGYPLISKSVAMKLSRYHRTKSQEQKDKRINGYIGNNGKLVTNGMIPKKYQELIYAPFEFSEKCCDKFKKKPLKEYEKKSLNFPITGELAEESKDRKSNYLKHGCINITSERNKCTPMGFWTKLDILECIKRYNIEISALYGEVVKDEETGLLKFSKEQRTGCDICGFGLLFDLERLDRFKERHPKQYAHMMEGGEWIQKEIYRPMKFYPTDKIQVTNWYWVPNEEGYGYKFVLEYLFEVLGIEKQL